MASWYSFHFIIKWQISKNSLCTSSCASDWAKLLQESTRHWNLLSGIKRWEKFKYLVSCIQKLSDISYQCWASMSWTEENMAQIKACVFENICVPIWNLGNRWKCWVGSSISNLTQDLKMQWTDEQKQNHVNIYGLKEKLGYPQVMCFFFCDSSWQWRGGDCGNFKIKKWSQAAPAKIKTQDLSKCCQQ